jgi:hypothetical protein
MDSKQLIFQVAGASGIIAKNFASQVPVND